MRFLAWFAAVAGVCCAQDRAAPDGPYGPGNGVSAQSVDEQGNPQNVKILRPLGHGLDEKAIECVQQWKFKPGMKNGHPVAVQATVQINFVIDRGWRLADLSCQVGGTRPTVVRQNFPQSGEGQATITLAFEVDEHGAPRGLRVEKSSDATRDAELIAAVQEWEFSPGVKDGLRVVVPCTANFEVGAEGK